jgi:hypothetical protein
MYTYPLQLRGRSGQTYNFNVGNLGHNFGPSSGLYVLIGRNGIGSRPILYVGQTVNASDRPGPWCNGHHVQASAQRLGLTAIGFLRAAYQWERDAIERDLIGGLNPPLNVQHRRPFGIA